MQRNPINKRRETAPLPATSKLRTSAAALSQLEHHPPQREVKSKAAINRMISDLIEFLEFTEYPNAVHHRLLQAPNSKDVFCIFEHMLCQIDAHFRIDRQPSRVDEVLMTLRKLGYPQNLNKFYLSTPGAPHAWPSVLAAIDWLREEVTIANQIFERGTIFKFDDEQDQSQEPAGKIFHDFYRKAYDAQKNGFAVAQDASEKFRRDIKLVHSLLDEREMRQVFDRVAQMDAEMASYGSRQNHLELLQTQMSEYEAKVKPRNEAKKRTESTLKQLETQLKEREATVAELLEKHKMLKKQASDVQLRLKAQEEAGCNILVGEFQMLEEYYQRRLARKTELQNTTDEKELALSRREGGIAPVLDEYNRCIGTLLVPEWEAIAKSCNLQIRTYRTGFDMATELPALVSDLQSCLNCIKEDISSLQKKLTKLTSQIDETKLNKENLCLSACQKQKAELEEFLENLNQCSHSLDQENQVVEERLTDERTAALSTTKEAREKADLDREMVSEIETTYQTLSQDVPAKSAYCDDAKHMISLMVTPLRAFVELHKITAQAQETKFNGLLQFVQDRHDEMERRIDAALNSDSD